MSQPQPGFLVSPELLGKVRSTIARVDGEPIGGKTWTIPTRFEGDEGGEGGGRVFRICTFTGTWNIGDSKNVTFKYQASTPNTVVASNLFANIPSPSGTGDCAIGKDGTAWYLVEWLQPSTTSITVLTGATLTTAGLQFTRAIITVQATATQSVTIIGTTAC